MPIQIYAVDNYDLKPRRVEIKQSTYPGGEPCIWISTDGQKTTTTYQIISRIDSTYDMIELLCAVDTLDNITHIFIPYSPFARQDREQVVDVHGRKYMVGNMDVMWNALLESSLKFTQTIPTVLDKHSTKNGHSASKNIGMHKVIRYPDRFSPEHAVFICPDAGAVTRVQKLASWTGHEVVYADKNRSPNGTLSGFSIVRGEVPAGMNALIVDDICDGGGTFLGIADALGLDRDRLGLWTSHGIYSKGIDPLAARFSFIGTTDSHTGSSQLVDYPIEMSITPLDEMFLRGEFN
jgi:ribose-phosphate pyrophosphokinase